MKMNYLLKSMGRGGLCLVLLILMAFFAPLNANAQQTTITYHNGTSTTANLPFHSGWEYSFTEQLYSANDIGIAGDITSISFYLGQSYNAAQTNEITVYMKNVSRNSLSISNYEPVTSADIVFSGFWTIPASYTGWVAINLDTPFAYDGGNLMVAIHEYTSGYDIRYFYKTNTSYASSVQWYDDTQNPDPYNLGSYQGNYNTLYENSDIQIVITPSPTPKPKLLTVGNIGARIATLLWTAPNENVLNYQYQYKAGEGEWTDLETTTATSVNLTGLDLTTTYIFRVKAHYAVGDSDFATTTFTTNSSCEQPTNLTANAIGDATYATLTWKENGEANSWVLQYDTDYDFSNPTDVTTGFVVNGVSVSCTLTGLSEQTYYARVKPACDTEGTLWSDIINFTPSFANLVVGGTSTESNTVPIYGYYVGGTVYSQFIIPAESLDALAGGMVKRFTFYHNSWTFNMSGAEFEVYVTEVEKATFSSNQYVDWTTLTQVYSGSLSTEANMMIVTLDNEFMYEGGNLLIGFKQTVSGNGGNVNWYGGYGEGSGNRCLFSYNDSNVAGSRFMPKTTFSYIPTSYPRVASIEEGTITSTSATFSWAAPDNNVTGYAYQLKRLSDAEWPTQWTSLNATTVTIDNLSPITNYSFRVKVLYGANESVPRTISFMTECAEFADVPFTENFDGYVTGIDNGLPYCWKYISSTNYPLITSNDYYAHSGEKYLYFCRYSGETEQYAILPQMQNVNGLRIKFFARRGSNNTDSNIIVGVMTDPTDASTFQEMGTYTVGTSHQKYKVSLDSYMGVNGYIAFKSGTTNYCYVCIDDITVEPIPSCEEPEELEAYNVEAHTAAFSWTDSGNPSAWQIYVSTEDVMPAEPVATNLHNVNTNPATVSGLAPETDYYAWVRSSCGTSGEYSPWSDPVNFTTGIACPQNIYLYYQEADIAATYATIRWDSEGQETAWQICLNNDESNLYDATSNTYTVTGLTPETEYSVKVRANCGAEDGYSSWSSERWFTTDFCDPEDKCNISYDFIPGDVYGQIVFMSDETEVAWVELYHGPGEIALCPGEYDIIWQGCGNGSFAIYGSDGNEIYSTDNVDELEWEDVLVSDYNHVCEGVCFPPKNLDVIAFSTSATLTWEPGGGETEWKVQWCEPYSQETVTFEGMTELPAEWIPDSDGEGAGYVVANDCLQLNSVEDGSAQILIPVVLGGTYSLQAKALGSAPVTLYIGWESNLNDSWHDDWEFELSNGDYQPITINSAGYGGEGLFWYAIDGACSIAIDDVKIGNISPENYVHNTPSFTIENLTPGVSYMARVKAVCDQEDESGWKETTFITLPAPNKTFDNDEGLGDGKWDTRTNWEPEGVPTDEDVVLIDAAATIHSGCVAEAASIIIGTGGSLTIEDGGALSHVNKGVVATVKKTISAYDPTAATTDGWYLIASPLATNVAPANVTNMVTSPEENYDLFKFNQFATGSEWQNFKQNHPDFTSLEPKVGYLYANAGNNGQAVTLQFNGIINPMPKEDTDEIGEDDVIALYMGNGAFASWNLVGNPHVCPVYPICGYLYEEGYKSVAYYYWDDWYDMPYYRMNATNDELIVANYDQTNSSPILPGEGVFMQNDRDYDFYVRLSTEPFDNNIGVGGGDMKGGLTLNLTKDRGTAIDRAIVRFGEGPTLGKLMLNPDNTNICIPQGTEEFAIVRGAYEGEVPVNFKAEKNGTYSLSVNVNDAEMEYLHLVDNLTGADVDLLESPAYTFNAKTTDYASRFKLVFKAMEDGPSTGSGTFAYYNGSTWTVSNLGEATLQVIDAMGRILSSETIHGNAEANIQAAPGVYMLRLVNGDHVKVQKIIIK